MLSYIYVDPRAKYPSHSRQILINFDVSGLIFEQLSKHEVP
jgi:hypothetical protein